MSVTLLAQKCNIGDTEYYLTKIKASTLVQNVGYASEMEQWVDMSIDERMQREIKGDRVATEIVPYIVSDPEWFFGAFIVDIYTGWEEVEYQEIGEVVKVPMAAYKDTLKNVGFLTLPDNKVMIALDGQHRLAALSMAIRGQNGVPGSVKLSDSIKEQLTPHPEIGNADVSVIFIKHTDNSKIRKIFNKVNRYAKQTSKSDNIITSDDDIIAIVSRKTFSGEDAPLGPIDGAEIVNWKSNTIPARSKQLTTLSAIYTISETLLAHYEITSKTRLNEEDLAMATDIIMSFWKLSLEKIQVFKDYVDCVKKDKPLEKMRKNNLLLKPVTHTALAQAVYVALENGYQYEDIIDKINLIDWSQDNPIWANILVTNSNSKRMITGAQALRDAGSIIAYMLIGNAFPAKERERLLETLKKASNDENVELPPIV